jgi:competence protein ComEA
VTSGAVLAVGAGAFWLLRAPPTPVEDTLPTAMRTSTTVPSVASGGAPSTSTTAGPTTIVVDVAGAVGVPGVYTVAATARVHEAIAAAGGLGPDAGTDALNLAAPLHDGDRVYVPRIGEAPPLASAPASSGTAPTPSGPIDINAATVDELDALPGVGPATAAAIVAYRDAHGPFASVDELLEVRGIGPAKLDAIRALVTA